MSAYIWWILAAVAVAICVLGVVWGRKSQTNSAGTAALATIVISGIAALVLVVIAIAHSVDIRPPRDRVRLAASEYNLELTSIEVNTLATRGYINIEQDNKLVKMAVGWDEDGSATFYIVEKITPRTAAVLDRWMTIYIKDWAKDAYGFELTNGEARTLNDEGVVKVQFEGGVENIILLVGADDKISLYRAVELKPNR